MAKASLNVKTKFAGDIQHTLDTLSHGGTFSLSGEIFSHCTTNVKDGACADVKQGGSGWFIRMPF